MSTRLQPPHLRAWLALGLGLLCCAPRANTQELPIPPPLVAEPAGDPGDKLEHILKKSNQLRDRKQAFELMAGRWHLHAKMTRADTDRVIEYDGVTVGRFLAGSTFFQMETETFLSNGQRISAVSIQIYDSGSETYRMIENLGDKIMVEMVGRVSGDEIIWKPMHGISYEVAENVIRFVSPDLMESRTELQETLDSPKIVVVSQFRRVKDDVAPGTPALSPLIPALAPEKAPAPASGGK